MIADVAFELGKKTAKIALKKTVNSTYRKSKKILTSSEGIAGIASGTAAAMTTTSLGLKGAFLGSFVAVNASTVGVPIATVAGYMGVRTIKSYLATKENNKLKKKLLKYQSLIDNDEIFVRYNDINKTKILDIAGAAKHRDVFLQTIDKAKNTVVIYSGWATDYSINATFKDHLKDALLRGVDLYLGYGYVDSKKTKQVDKEKRIQAEKSLKSLQEWSATIQSKGKLYILKFPNHKKILTCDDEYIICGSYNWLSNNKVARNEEFSVQIFNKKYTKEKVELFVNQFENPKNSTDRRGFLNKFFPWSEYP